MEKNNYSKLENSNAGIARYSARQFQKLMILLIALSFSCFSLTAQNTPPNADSDAECGADCYDLFSWSPVQDGSGNNIPGFGEGIANDANCNTTIDASVEYVGNDNTPDLTGTFIGAGSQGSTLWTDTWTVGFGAELTSPILQGFSLLSTTSVTVTDCDGNAISITDISSGTVIPTGTFMGNDEVQLSGTYDCIIVTFSNDRNDPYTFSIGTCLGADPFPPCVACGANENFEFIDLRNKTGNGTGATADIELDNVLVGSAEVLFSDLDINEDLSGTTFGGFDNDGGTYLLKLEFCEPISIKQFEIKNLEVASEVSIGTTITGSGASATLGGVTLSQCGGSNRMSPNDGSPNLIITDGPGCSANPNGSYTVGDIMTDILYFKYHNPPGGCSYDYVGFKIGTCVTDGADAIPVCPLEYLTYATDIDDYVTNGPDFTGSDANAFQVMRDANGNFFNQNCTQIENEVNNMIAISTVAISPCAELVDVEECTFCDPPPPCVACPVGTENEFISLDKTGETAAGLDMGIVEIDGVCIGSYEFIFDDLDINTDGNGTTFGGFDNDGGTMILQVDFCDPLMVNQLDVRNLEVMSQVSVGTTISGTGATATLGGQTLTFCAGSNRMDVDDITNGNLITTAGPGCGANPNASYTFGTNPVSTLYFKYHNPVGGCSYDYVGFRISTCVTPPPMVVPVCPFEEVRVTCEMDDVIENGISNANTDVYVIDGAGNYFDYTNCNATALMNAYENGTMLQTVNIGCAEMVETVDECVPDDCVVPTTCAATTCPTDTNFDYIKLDADGTNAAGLPMGTVELNNIKIGTYEFVASDLDLSNDGNGTTFGGWDNDGGTMLLMLEFCDPLMIQELDIRNLEVGSQVSVGTTASSMDASAVLSGLNMTFCAGSDRMTLNDGAPNLVITDGPGCGANPNATYTVIPQAVSTLYFKYHNPPSDGTFPSRCRGDYVGFKIGACTPEPVMAAPTCPLELFTIDDCPNDPNNPTNDYYRDVNGNWFESNICVDPIDEMTVLETVQISPCASMTFVEECEFCCQVEIFCPAPGTFDCEDDAGIDAWLASYTTEMCDEPGLTIMTDYDRNDFDKCQTTTNSITFSISDATGVLSSCSVNLTINAAAPSVLTPPTLPTVLSCEMADGYVAPDATFTNNLTGVCENMGSIASTMQYNFDACGGTMIVTYSGQDECGVTLTAGPFVIDVEPAPVPVLTVPAYASPMSCADAENFVAPIASYGNGLSGICNISGTFTAGVDNNWDACGGTIVMYYFGSDACGNFISLPPLVIDVQPAPLPAIALPVLPTSISCEDAATYTPPSAAFDNGVVGACNISGNVSAVINSDYNSCGGVLEIIYLGTDDCGRNLVPVSTIITVDPAPAPVIDLPVFSSEMTCSEANSLDGGFATYSNGLTGDCEVSGFLAATIDHDVTAIDGGTLTITYSGMDECGNMLSSTPIVINVLPATLPTVQLPDDPISINCSEAENYIPSPATFSNGEEGFCENSGPLDLTTNEAYWNPCDGGYILLQYSGFDNGGNFIQSDLFKVAVTPGAMGGSGQVGGECTEIVETVEDIKNTPTPSDLDPYKNMITENLYGYCGELTVTVIGDTGTPECGTDGTFSRVYDVEITNECGDVIGTCSITFHGNCNPNYCTLSEDFYSSSDEQFGGFTAIGMINELIDFGNNPIKVGAGNDCGMILDNAACIQDVLAGEGQSTALPNGYVLTCGEASNNNLVDQIITTTLNIRYNAQMNGAGLDYGNFEINAACIYCPAFIKDALPANATVNDLLDYANAFIGCQCTDECGNYNNSGVESAITNILLGLNSRFDKCYVPGPCFLTNETEPGDGVTIFPNTGDQTADNGNNTDPVKVNIFPNPANDILNVEIKEVKGESTIIDIFDAQGRKVGQQSYASLDQNIIELEVQNFPSGMYWISIQIDGYERVSKRFIIRK